MVFLKIKRREQGTLWEGERNEKRVKDYKKGKIFEKREKEGLHGGERKLEKREQ